MGFYARAFCRSDDLPSLGQVLDWASARTSSLEFDGSGGDPDSDEWPAVEIRYRPGRQPLVIEANRADGGEVFAEEVEEFLELLYETVDTAERAVVIEHLRASRAVVAVQLLNDAEEDGLDAVDVLLTCFVEHCGGMVQVDGEGFYDRGRLNR